LTTNDSKHIPLIPDCPLQHSSALYVCYSVLILYWFNCGRSFFHH